MFTAETIVASVLKQFRQCASEQHVEITAYCFMPDHLHLLCTALSESADLRRFVCNAKQETGYAFARSFAEPLWQKGFYDHVLRDEEATLPIVRYIFANPIRAGLSTVLGEYPFCASDVFSTKDISECLQIWTPHWQP